MNGIEDDIEPYNDTRPIGDGRENVLVRDADGNLSVKKSEKQEGIRFTPAHRKAVRDCPDDSIARVAETALAIYYAIDRKMTVTYRGRGIWSCLYATAGERCMGSIQPERNHRKECVHIERVSRWVSEGNDKQPNGEGGDGN